MNDDDGGEVTRAFFSSLGKRLLSHSLTLTRSPTNTLSLPQCLSLFIARTHRAPHEVSPPRPSRTINVSLLLLQLQYYYNKILLPPLPPLALMRVLR